MKVIEQGRKQQGWASEHTCTGTGNGGGGCMTKLLVEEADVYLTARHCRDETDYFTTFRCCECGVETDITDVPGAIRQRLIGQGLKSR